MEAFRRLPEYLQRQPMPFHLWLRKMAYERLIMMRRRHLGASCRAVGNELPLPEQSSVMLAKNLLANETSPSQQVETRNWPTGSAWPWLNCRTWIARSC